VEETSRVEVVAAARRFRLDLDPSLPSHDDCIRLALARDTIVWELLL
jgi:hypothetical protein